MQKVTIDELAWLHDCDLHSVAFEAASDGSRTVRWTISCPSDLGHAPWAGKDLVLVAIDVAMLRHFAWGTTGRETIDAIRPGVSRAAAETTRAPREAGMRFPDIQLTVDMHSGSSMEVICGGLEVGAREG